MTIIRRLRPLRSIAGFVVLAVGCSGKTFTTSDGDSGMAGMSATGGSGGRGGTVGGGTGGGVGGGNELGGASGLGGTSGRGGTAGSGAVAGTGGTSGSGATAGVGGASGASGTSGSAGTWGEAGAAGSGGSECQTGQGCPVEGATCSLGGCCACMHTCTSGAWGQPLCPPCAAPTCPDVVPTNGDECFECDIPSEGCQWDERPVDGPLYIGKCVMNHWEVTVGGQMPGCCMADSECAPQICVNTICEVVQPGSCWRDDECGSDQICAGAFVCPCTADCASRDYSGKCVPAGLDCCRTDADCAGAHCIAGVCKESTLPGCWDQRDCTLPAACAGATVCPCGTNCLVADSPGTCVIPL